MTDNKMKVAMSVVVNVSGAVYVPVKCAALFSM